MKYKYLFGILLFFSCLCFYFFYLIYSDAKDTAISELNSRQMIHAKQSETGIKDFFDNLISFLTDISGSNSIIDLDDSGKKMMDFSLNFNSKAVTAITRVDQSGRIIYTSPYNEKLIGQDISGQKHIQKIMTSHKPVISDVFTAVQGYAAIALHVPVFDGNQFRGTLGVLINFGALSKRYLDQIKIGETGHAWMTSREGIELYCPVPGHIGKSVFENRKGFPSVIAMAKEMVEGRQGVTTYMFDHIKEQHTSTLKKHAVYLPVRIVDNFWTIVVASSENEILASLVQFRNKIMILAGMLLFGSILFSYYGMKAWGIVREREERQRVEAALKFEQNFIKEALDVQNDTFFVFDPTTGKALQWNKTFREITGYSDEEIENLQAPDSYYSPDDMLLAKEYIEKILTGGKGTLQLDLICKDGRRVATEYSASILKGGEDAPVRLIAVGRDISERRKVEEDRLKLEAQLQQTQKLDSLGVLAGGIAHDFNNILTAVMGNISIVKLSLKPGDPSVENLTNAEKATIQATKLTQQLLTFAKGGTPVLKTISIAGILTDAIGFALHGSNVKCKSVMPEDLWPVRIDTGQITQVFQNLLINANQAMSSGGMITVEAGNVLVDAKNILNLKEGRYVKIVIADQGAGIPQGHIKKIFDPFFSTKTKGTGLGLATSYSIIKRHLGAITVDSMQNVGSTFHVYLPASEMTPQPEETVADEISMGKGRILIMDDEQAVRNILSVMLKRTGYEVELSNNGHEALKLYRQALEKQKPFDAVILDLTIPGGMGGLETLTRLKEMTPDVKAIVSSGYADDPILAHYQQYGFAGAVSKPYRVQFFSKVLHDVLTA